MKDFCQKCLNKDPAGRPGVKDLMKHKFITKAKKTSNLIDLIDKYRKWVDNGGHDSDSSSDEERDDDGPMEDPNWEFGTIKGGPSGGGGAASAAAAPAEDAKDRMLKSVILPALVKIKREQGQQNPDRSASDLATITELSKAFELAETSKPGVLDALVQEICTTMLSL